MHPFPRLLKLGEPNPIRSLFVPHPVGLTHNSIVSGKMFLNGTIIFTSVILALPSILEKVYKTSNFNSRNQYFVNIFNVFLYMYVCIYTYLYISH